MDATTPSSSDPRELPTNSIEALPKAIRLALTELVDPTYRELEAGDWLFWKNAILLTKSGTQSGAARLGSYFIEGELTINRTYSQRKNKRCLNWTGVICRLRPARSEKVGI
jgi:hypothetical protein